MTVHLLGPNINDDDNNNNNTHKNHNFECLYFMFVNHHICVVLRSTICHMDGWNCPKFVHNSKYTYI
jgi:hypothetical protein